MEAVRLLIRKTDNRLGRHAMQRLGMDEIDGEDKPPRNTTMKLPSFHNSYI